MTEGPAPSLSAERRQAVGDCLAAQKACAETAAYCEQQGGRYSEQDRVGLLRRCAEICARTAESLQGQGSFDQRLAEQCAEICADVGRGMAAFEDDARMRACGEAALRCTSALKRLAEPAPPVDYDKIDAASFPASDPPATIGADLDVRANGKSGT